MPAGTGAEVGEAAPVEASSETAAQSADADGATLDQGIAVVVDEAEVRVFTLRTRPIIGGGVPVAQPEKSQPGVGGGRSQRPAAPTEPPVAKPNYADQIQEGSRWGSSKTWTVSRRVGDRFTIWQAGHGGRVEIDFVIEGKRLTAERVRYTGARRNWENPTPNGGGEIGEGTIAFKVTVTYTLPGSRNQKMTEEEAIKARLQTR